MPITIKEIIASDTISQLVDKTNFNFDQLLLNGGGPLGPAGAIGPTGPAGGRGEKGTTWYDGTVSPNVTAPTATPLKSDYYLQDSGTTPPTAGDGDVWEYTGLTWTNTGVNILGPIGPQGASGGFGKEFGGPVQITKQTARYNGPIGLGNGATTGAGGNEGVPSVMIGGVVSNTQALAGIPLTAAYVIPDTIATTLISTTASLMIHQKDSSARGIIFHGGNAAGNNDKFEQNSIGQLSGIFIGTDDKLVLDVPKVATTPTTQADLIGFELNVPNRSHVYTAGKEISFQTGTNNSQLVGTENSNFTINVGNGSNAGGNKFAVSTAGTSGSSLLEMGAGFTDVTTTTRVGQLQVQAGKINLVTSSGKPIFLESGGAILLSTINGSNPTGAITNTTMTGAWRVNTQGGAISLNQFNAAVASTIVIQNFSTQDGGDVRIQGKRLTALKHTSLTSLEAPSIVIDQTGTITNPQPFTRFVGKQTISDTGLSGITYPGTSHNTLIYKEPETVVSSANAIMELTGTSANIDYAPGIFLQAWTGGTQSTSGVSAGLLAVNLGQEGPQSPVPTGYERWDNSLGFGVRNSGNTKDYFNASAAKIGIATPIVLKRSNNLNTSINSNPNTTVWNSSGGSAPAPLNFGWNTWQSNAPAAVTASSPSVGMPTTAQLDVPFMSLNFGPGLGYGNMQSQTLQNSNYDYTFNFPIGSYPGQRITLKFYLQSLTFSQINPSTGLSLSYVNNGIIRIRFPKYRLKVPEVGGTFTQWWQEANGLSPFLATPAYQEISMGPVLQPADGAGLIRMIELIWDGQTISQQGARVNVSPSGRITQTQHGWMILNDFSSTFNVQGIQTAGYQIGGTCFIAGTKVTMSDRSIKNIEDVKVGDEVLSQSGVNKVLSYDRPTLGIRKLYSFNGGTAFVTSEHPFMSTDGWKSIDPSKTAEENSDLSVSMLKVGDEIITDSKTIIINSIEEHDGDSNQTLYNFELGGDNTYYADSYLVHNKIGS